MSEKVPISRNKLISGIVIFALGFLSPLLIPLVGMTDWPVSVKALVSGVLAFGVPELFMLLAVVVMGKPGYQFMKQQIGKFFKPLMPPDEVSPVRYKLGLVLFCIPLIFGLAEPYLAYFFEYFKDLPLAWHICLDLLFVLSLFILGGNFWDKLSGLFQYDVRAQKIS